MSYPLRTKLVFSSRRINSETTPDEVLKSIWVSTALALMLSLPSLGIFLGLLLLTNNIIASSLSGFTFHFILFALSPRISRELVSLFNQ
jgi:putative Mn2+ efflux pump MntP